MGASVFGLFVCTSYIGLSCMLAFWLCKVLGKFLPGPSLPKAMIQEAIAAAELCACCFELIIVADNYGIWAYAVYLFVLTIWWSLSWEDATACPYTHLEEVVEGKLDVRHAGLKIWAELSGGLVVYKYVMTLWSLEIASVHKSRAYEECTADLQVNFILGALIEALATCLCRLFSRLIGEWNPRFGVALDSFIGTSLVVAAFNYSGGYFNPVLATALKYGCQGNTNAEHIIVYWVGACSGAILSVFLYQQSIFQAIARKVKSD
ncbi:hypothetical protein LSTR_LSTR004928 [Laodelphax striatellus]|uniref:Aquaporin n=1 Tax=Laodelphax striatellus TaxID=195883 RepID=A0A482XPA0_LAOST|nr:hypothetical protein LSTR_LSTR004928 [Laodelphax striatellus]